MRKFFTLFLCVLMLSGCARKKAEAVSGITAYEGYYKAIEDNDRFQNSSSYYKISAEMAQVADGSYRYYVFLDDVQIAMYDVVMMAVENKTVLSEAAKMMPSIGVFEKTDYSLIPFQARPEKGFVKGLVISGECPEPQVNLRLMVEWRDKSRENSYREYIEIPLDQDGFASAGYRAGEGE